MTSSYKSEISCVLSLFSESLLLSLEFIADFINIDLAYVMAYGDTGVFNY